MTAIAKTAERLRPTARRLTAVLLGALALALAVPMTSASASPAALTITPTTWNVVGLDSNNESTGPSRFPVGVRVCNTGTIAATNVSTTFVWDTSNAYLTLIGPATLAHGTLAGSSCREVTYEVDIQRTAPAKDTARRFHVTATADTLGVVSTPTPRELYVESLVSQGRNSVQAITGAGGVGDPAATSVFVGQSYTYRLFSSTATTYAQLETSLNFPSGIFRLDSISQSYSDPSGTTSSSIYGDACGYQPNPTLPNYRKCVGPESIAGGKVGGSVATTYQVTIVGTGTAQLAGLIYDFSGSSYHYNADYGVGVNSLTVTASNAPPASADLSMTAAASPDQAITGQNVTDTFTVSNGSAQPAQSAVFTDAIPAGAAYVSSTPSQGSCSFESGTVTCNLGDVAANGSATVAVVLTTSTAGTLSNQAGVTSATSDPDSGNNQATASSQVNDPAPPPAVGSPDLVVTETSSPSPANISQPLTFTFTVRNVGTSGATGVSVTDALPSSLQFVSATTSQGSCSESGGIVTCDLGDLAAGDSLTVDIVVIPWVLGPVSNAGSVGSNETDANPVDNSGSASTRVSATCTIVGTKGADRIVGTPGNDVICGLWGRDVIFGMGGDDVIFGDWNSDFVYGGDGNDMLWGKAGRDQLFGEAGNDILKGGYNNDTLDARDDVPSNDTMDGGKGSDVFLGDAGDCQYDSRDN